jgi:hypothetical protein
LLATAGLPQPGRYTVEVRQRLPNVPDLVDPMEHSVCLDTAPALAPFRLKGENPLRSCPIVEVEWNQANLRYRIVCPGPNRGFAEAEFAFTIDAFHGQIAINMGGKNMTLTEIQTGRRRGDCD